MNQERYKILNTTVKAPKIVNGKDMRKPSERVGHFLLIKEGVGDNAKQTIIPPNKFAIVGYLDEGLMELEASGKARIEQVKDMGSVLETFRAQKKLDSPAAATGTPGIRASAMGDAPIPSKGSTEHEGAVNPDGDPSFIVKAPHVGGMTNPVLGESSADSKT